MAGVTRESLADKLYNEVEVTKGTARDLVSLIFDTMTAAVLAGEDVRIHGFGTFKSVSRAASTRRNPRTGEPVQVPAHRAVRFVPSTTINSGLRASGGKSGAKRSSRKKTSSA